MTIKKDYGQKKRVFYRPYEIADLLKVHISTVRRYMEQKKIPFSRVGRLYFIPREFVEEIKKGEVNTEQSEEHDNE